MELYLSFMVVLKALTSNTDRMVSMIHVVLLKDSCQRKYYREVPTGQLQVLKIKYKIGFLITTAGHYHKAY